MGHRGFMSSAVSHLKITLFRWESFFVSSFHRLFSCVRWSPVPENASATTRPEIGHKNENPATDGKQF